ncbi:MAG: helix-turn-helix domain-containing protein [Pseudonocardiales bacterium]
MDDLEARTVGEQVRRIRKIRRKSLRVIAGLAGMSASSLSRTENGLRALDSRSEIGALADALGVAPSELTGMAELTPAGAVRFEKFRRCKASRFSFHPRSLGFCAPQPVS